MFYRRADRGELGVTVTVELPTRLAVEWSDGREACVLPISVAALFGDDPTAGPPPEAAARVWERVTAEGASPTLTDPEAPPSSADRGAGSRARRRRSPALVLAPIPTRQSLGHRGGSARREESTVRAVRLDKEKVLQLDALRARGRSPADRSAALVRALVEVGMEEAQDPAFRQLASAKLAREKSFHAPAAGGS